VPWDDVPHEPRAAFHVVVIGAAMSGLLAAIRLEQAGIPYVVIEKNDGVGGTWLQGQNVTCREPVPPLLHCAGVAHPDRSRWPVRRYRLGDEPADDLSTTTSATERLAMMWPLACEAWRIAGRPLPSYGRSDMPSRRYLPGECIEDE
jgi:hypothetical protein